MGWLADFRHLLTGKVRSAPERRVYPRYRITLAVSVAAGAKTWQARTYDLSLSGMGVYIEAELELGERVSLTYELGDGSPVKNVSAIVRNRNGHRYGLEFVIKR